MADNDVTEEETNLYTIAFYNLENLFDTVDDPDTLDDEYLPDSEKGWSNKRYKSKLYKLGTVISNIGYEVAKRSPALIGVAEVENLTVLEDLIQTRHLRNKGYGIVHYDSPDERGIDVGLLYKKEFFEVLHSEVFPLYIEEASGVQDLTRDILYVKGTLNNEEVHILVNHWPSRRQGAGETDFKRIAAANKNREIINGIRETNPMAKIIVMGDFNDDPDSTSIKDHLVQTDLYNPMELLLTKYSGSTSYQRSWNLFDQIIFSHNFHKFDRGKHTFAFSEVFGKDYLKIYKGKFKGTPFRTYAGRKYLGGYSDHFPVFIQLRLND